MRRFSGLAGMFQLPNPKPDVWDLDSFRCHLRRWGSREGPLAKESPHWQVASFHTTDGKTMKLIRRGIYPLSFLLLVWASLLGQHHEHGKVDFPISCDAEAQSSFQTGLALLHHMMYEQAEERFAAAALSDPDCAMAYWGIGMTQLRPLWAPPTESQFEKGRSAVRKAAKLEAQTERERAYIRALEGFYREDGLSFRSRLATWEAGQKELWKAFPDDIEAGAFYALAQIAVAPPDDRSFQHQRRAGALLEKLHAKAPEHPGLFHYIIHSYDNPVLAEHAVEVAHGYDKLAPDVPHALHMPSHIFVRLGIWPDVIAWNIRSAEAALRQPVDGATSHHHAHALDYLIYAHLQRGEDEKALKALKELNSVDNYQTAFSAAYGIAASQARYPLERRQWAEASALPLRTHDAFPWDRYPWYEAITYFARGLGAARSGEPSAARQAIEELDAIYQRTLDAGEDYWAVHVDVQRKTIAAWIHIEEGNRDEALRLMRQAADLEDSVDKHPVTPGAVLPARELYADMLSKLGRYDEALAAYQAALAISPGRFNSLYGAGHAAEKAGKKELARKFYAKLAEIAAEDASRRAELTRAQSFLAPR